MSGAANRVKDRVDDGIAYAQEHYRKLGNPLPGKEAFAQAKSSLAGILARQPLVLGAVGLAIGAAVAEAFQTAAPASRGVSATPIVPSWSITGAVGGATVVWNPDAASRRLRVPDAGHEPARKKVWN